jgi:hypothetical protein
VSFVVPKEREEEPMTDMSNGKQKTDKKAETDGKSKPVTDLSPFVCTECLRYNADGKKQEIDPKTEICGVIRDGSGCGFCGWAEAKCPLGWCAGRPFCKNDEPIPACILECHKGFCANCAAALWCQYNTNEDGELEDPADESDE